MLKTLRLAADARHAGRILSGVAFADCDTLAEKAEVAVDLLNCQHGDIRRLDAELGSTKIALMDAEQKIARMTSGLRRGSKPKQDA